VAVTLTVSPGEILVLFGSGIGTAPVTVAGAGDLQTTLGGSQVFFGATPAPLIYTHDRQVACIVPYLVAGPTVLVTVVYNAVTSNAITLNVAAASPALFTIDGSGRGQVAAINSDGTINSEMNPASRRSIVMLFCTGEGDTNPAGVDGQINLGPVFPVPLAPVSVTIGGFVDQGSLCRRSRRCGRRPMPDRRQNSRRRRSRVQCTDTVYGRSIPQRDRHHAVVKVTAASCSTDKSPEFNGKASTPLFLADLQLAYFWYNHNRC
jgi:uncharacterized protein (TIGR03437 family)